jgi:hypothetical protein
MDCKFLMDTRFEAEESNSSLEKDAAHPSVPVAWGASGVGVEVAVEVAVEWRVLVHMLCTLWEKSPESRSRLARVWLSVASIACRRPPCCSEVISAEEKEEKARGLDEATAGAGAETAARCLLELITRADLDRSTGLL